MLDICSTRGVVSAGMRESEEYKRTETSSGRSARDKRFFPIETLWSTDPQEVKPRGATLSEDSVDIFSIPQHRRVSTTVRPVLPVLNLGSTQPNGTRIPVIGQFSRRSMRPCIS